MSNYHERPYSEQADMYESDKTIGCCPVCGRQVVAGQKSYYCLGILEEIDFRGTKVCRFWLTKNRLQNLGKYLITLSEMKALLGGDSITLENLRKKDGETFSCEGILNFDDEYGWGIKFIWPKNPITKAVSHVPPPKRLRPLSGKK